MFDNHDEDEPMIDESQQDIPREELTPPQVQLLQSDLESHIPESKDASPGPILKRSCKKCTCYPCKCKPKSCLEIVFQPWISARSYFSKNPQTPLNNTGKAKLVTMGCMGDLNSGFATSLVAAPIGLSLIASLNSLVGKDDQVPIGHVMWSIIFGYLMSGIINGGIPMIKSFTRNFFPN